MSVLKAKCQGGIPIDEFTKSSEGNFMVKSAFDPIIGLSDPSLSQLL